MNVGIGLRLKDHVLHCGDDNRSLIHPVRSLTMEAVGRTLGLPNIPRALFTPLTIYRHCSLVLPVCPAQVSGNVPHQMCLQDATSAAESPPWKAPWHKRWSGSRPGTTVLCSHLWGPAPLLGPSSSSLIFLAIKDKFEAFVGKIDQSCDHNIRGNVLDRQLNITPFLFFAKPQLYLI